MAKSKIPDDSPPPDDRLPLGEDISGGDVDVSEGRPEPEPALEPKKPSGRPKGDPLAVLSGDGLSEEGRSLAGALRHLQSMSDSRAARLEGALQQISASIAAIAQRPASGPVAPAAPEHPFSGVELTPEQRGAIQVVESLLDHRLKSGGYSGLSKELETLRGELGEMRQLMGRSQARTVEDEAREVLENYTEAEVRQLLPTLRGMRGLPHPTTGRPMTLFSAMQVLRGTVPTAEPTPENEIILGAKRNANRPTGAAGRSPGGKVSEKELEAELAALFGGA